MDDTRFGNAINYTLFGTLIVAGVIHFFSPTELVYLGIVPGLFAGVWRWRCG